MWSLFWPRRPREKFSLENLRYLYQELVTHDVVNDANKEVVVEILRSIAELMIWGDQHNDHVFYFFCEKNILGHFLRILSLPLDRQITVQILQTLSIMIQNFNRQTSVFYLLSNNHVNALILHPFDFGDEEVIAYYISFLKTLSLKLNRDTLQFFFNRDDATFPLYSQAIQFFHHAEAMVRIAVRTITLNVYRVDDADLRRFVVDVSAVPYFSNLVWFIRGQIGEVDALLRRRRQQAEAASQLVRLLDTQIDQFHYIMDIVRLQIDALNQVLVQQLLDNFVVPVLVEALVAPAPTTVSPRLALFVLFQIFHIVTDRRLVMATAGVLFRPATSVRPALLQYLTQADEAEFAAALILALVRNAEIDPDLLQSIDLCPQRTMKKRRLLSSLLSSQPTTPSRTPEPLPRMRLLSDALQSAESATAYAEDVIDACLRSFEAHLPSSVLVLIGHVVVELVHVERGGLNSRHSEALLRLIQAPCPIDAKEPPGMAPLLAALSEPRAILTPVSRSEGVAHDDDDDDRRSVCLHWLIRTLTSFSVEPRSAASLPHRTSPSEPNPSTIKL